MDHRCLYGHRVQTELAYAIERRTCPTCGAPTVTVQGYRLARKLTKEVPLGALEAFHTVRVVELNYTIEERIDTEAQAIEAQNELSVAEIELDDSEMEAFPPDTESIDLKDNGIGSDDADISVGDSEAEVVA